MSCPMQIVILSLVLRDRLYIPPWRPGNMAGHQDPSDVSYSVFVTAERGQSEHSPCFFRHHHFPVRTRRA